MSRSYRLSAQIISNFRDTLHALLNDVSTPWKAYLPLLDSLDEEDPITATWVLDILLNRFLFSVRATCVYTSFSRSQRVSDILSPFANYVSSLYHSSPTAGSFLNALSYYEHFFLPAYKQFILSLSEVSQKRKVQLIRQATALLQSSLPSLSFDSSLKEAISNIQYPLQDRPSVLKKVFIGIYTNAVIFKSNLADADSHTPHDFYEAAQLLKKSFGVQLGAKILDRPIDYSSAGFFLTLSMRSAENSYYTSFMHQAQSFLELAPVAVQFFKSRGYQVTLDTETVDLYLRRVRG